jgi:hypothetical protein
MLTQQEKDFIQYWAANRLRRKKVVTQFLVGIPIGLAFTIPIVINFVSGWYKRAQMEANNQDFNPGVLLVALLLIVGFTAIFYQRHQWDQYEQRYRELLARETRENAPPSGIPSIPPTEAPLLSSAGTPSNPHTELPLLVSDAPASSSSNGLSPSPDGLHASQPPSPDAPNPSPSEDMEQKTGKN